MATGVISVALARPLADALALLRAHAFTADRTVDDAAHDIVTGSPSPYRLTPDINMLTNPSKPNRSEGPPRMSSTQGFRRSRNRVSPTSPVVPFAEQDVPAPFGVRASPGRA